MKKLYLVILGVVVLGIPSTAQAGWSDPVSRTMDCLIPMAWGNCIFVDQSKNPKAVSGDHFYRGQRVYPQASQVDTYNYNYKAPKMQKPARAMRDERIK